jgi:hypothetical protein
MPYEFLGILVMAAAWYLARGRSDHTTLVQVPATMASTEGV